MVKFMLTQLDAITVGCFSLPASKPHLCCHWCLMKWVPQCSGASAALTSPCPSPQLLLLLFLCCCWFRCSLWQHQWSMTLINQSVTAPTISVITPSRPVLCWLAGWGAGIYPLPLSVQSQNCCSHVCYPGPSGLCLIKTHLWSYVMSGTLWKIEEMSGNLSLPSLY